VKRRSSRHCVPGGTKYPVAKAVKKTHKKRRKVERTILVCSLCNVGSFCSEGCQMRHQFLHQGECQKIANLRDRAKEMESRRENNQAGGLHFKMGLLYIFIGLKNPHSRQFFCRQALTAWMEGWRLVGPSNFFRSAGLENTLLILLSCLRVDRKAMAEWCWMSPGRQKPFMDLEADDFPLQLARLLTFMQDLAEQQSDYAALAALEALPWNQPRRTEDNSFHRRSPLMLPEDVCTRIKSFLPVPGTLEKDITSLLSGMEKHGHRPVLEKLRDEKRFGINEERSLAGQTAVRSQDRFARSTPYPRQSQTSNPQNDWNHMLWYLVRDTMKTTPGLLKILRELLPKSRDPAPKKSDSKDDAHDDGKDLHRDDVEENNGNQNSFIGGGPPSGHAAAVAE